jgi:hypothetical protein
MAMRSASGVAAKNWSAEFIPREGLDPREAKPATEDFGDGLVEVTGEVAAEGGWDEAGSAEFIPREPVGMDLHEVKPVAEVFENGVGEVTRI